MNFTAPFGSVTPLQPSCAVAVPLPAPSCAEPRLDRYSTETASDLGVYRSSRSPAYSDVKTPRSLPPPGALRSLPAPTTALGPARPLRLEAVGAVYWPIATRDERHLRILATLGTHSRVHFSGRPVVPTAATTAPAAVVAARIPARLALCPARRTARRLIGKAAASEELLFSDRKTK